MVEMIRSKEHSPWCAVENMTGACNCHLATREGRDMKRQVLKEPGATPDADPFNPLKDKPMPMHVQRMAAETQQVVTNLRKLSDFINDPASAYVSLPQLEQQLMIRQRDQMQEYARTLSLRYCMALLDHG